MASSCTFLYGIWSRVRPLFSAVRLPNRTGALERHFAHCSSNSTRWQRISQRSSLAAQSCGWLETDTSRRWPHCSVTSNNVAADNSAPGRHMYQSWNLCRNVGHYTRKHITEQGHKKEQILLGCNAVETNCIGTSPS